MIVNSTDGGNIVLKGSSLVLAIAAMALLVMPKAGLAANSAPAIVAFDAAFAKVTDCTYKLHAHEVLGSATQDRVYDYSFMKPHFAKTLIESGDGKGSGGVWSGGDTVSGHQGGFLSGIHLTVSLNDHRATSLRGYTIPDGLMQNIVATYANTPGKLSQSPGGKIAGVDTDRLVLDVTDPSSDGGVSKKILYLSQTTHFPMREIMYAGAQVVLDQSITDIKTNVGLTQGDF